MSHLALLDDRRVLARVPLSGRRLVSHILILPCLTEMVPIAADVQCCVMRLVKADLPEQSIELSNSYSLDRA